MDNYILDDDLNPVAVSMDESVNWCKDTEEWYKKKRMAVTTFTSGERVSTVFLGSDHGHDDSTPILFETLVFDEDGSGLDETMTRYATFDEAIQGHKKAVEHICMTSGVILVIEKEYIKERPPKLPVLPRKLEYCNETNVSILKRRLVKGKIK